MRIYQLFEIDLGLSDRQMRRINPLVGFEFEMYVNDVDINDADDTDIDQEPD